MNEKEKTTRSSYIIGFTRTTKNSYSETYIDHTSGSICYGTQYGETSYNGGSILSDPINIISNQPISFISPSQRREVTVLSTRKVLTSAHKKVSSIRATQVIPKRKKNCNKRRRNQKMKLC